MKFPAWQVLVVIIVFALFVRLWGISNFPSYYGDEGVHVPSAITLGEYGTPSCDNWTHPQLSGLILYYSIKLFGDNPSGWRAPNIIFGTVSVLLLYLVALRLYPGRAAPLLAAALMALDPFHAYFSRTTFMEIPVACFFLLYLYLMLLASEGKRSLLPLAGVAMGLTMATKGYFLGSIIVVAGYVFYKLRQQEGLRVSLVLDFMASLLVLPTAVYVLVHYPWFGRGHTIAEFITRRQDAVWVLRHLTDASMSNLDFIRLGGLPWEWFLKPILFGFRMSTEGDYGSFRLQINNFPFRILVVPSLVIAGVVFWKRKNLKEVCAPVLFLSVYLLFFVLQRPMFSHSALVLIPFAYLMVGRAVELVAQWQKAERIVYPIFVGGVISWGLYTFPLYSGIPVPLHLYGPLLALAKLMG